MTIRDRLTMKDDLLTYDVPLPSWGRYIGWFVPLVTLIGVWGYLGGGWWRLVAASCALVLLMLTLVVVRWERGHKRPVA
jgi:hypothetical protein